MGTFAKSLGVRLVREALRNHYLHALYTHIPFYSRSWLLHTSERPVENHRLFGRYRRVCNRMDGYKLGPMYLAWRRDDFPRFRRSPLLFSLLHLLLYGCVSLASFYTERST